MSAEEEPAQIESENNQNETAEEEEVGDEEGVQDDDKAEEAQEAQEEAEATVKSGIYNARDVVDHSFEELVLGDEMVAEINSTWTTFLRSAESREAAGEAIYAALFEAAPSLHNLFKTPRAVMAMRFMNGLNQIISSLHDPPALKVVVETLGFQHLDLEVTIPRVLVFRDAIVDLLQAEMRSTFTKKAKEGWMTFLNYVGGAYIYVRVKFADRLRILASSWGTANNTSQDALEGGEGEGEGEEGMAGDTSAVPQAQQAKNAKEEKKGSGWSLSRKSKGLKGLKGGETDAEKAAAEGAGNKGADTSFQNTNVPTTFNEMFIFNAAVMGFGQCNWMQEVLASFDAIVTNVSNSYRLQEECDVLSLRIAKTKGQINLSAFKAVMLASLRSLVPKDWDSAHEVAWSWLWDNVERMLKAIMGKPLQQERALQALWASLTEESQAYVRREVYLRFFALAPSGQDFFKQSTTRLHFIADRVTAMTLDMYVDPKRMVEDISALGLRHVGYGIPTDLFGAFVTGCVQVVRSLTDNDTAEEAFRWSLSLISRILTRVINEGSTIVMKAINANSGKMLKKAVGCAPRGKRALWMLNIQVGTQSISPLMWAIETGGLEAAGSIITDLLTIRADRERYYYGMETLFERHPDIVKRMCEEAIALIPTLLNGLIWRSRTTENGLRRVNYYIKYFVVDAEDHFSQAIEWIADTRDPKLICHPVLSMVTDLIWSRVATRTFLYGKTWFVFTLLIFVLSQSILNHLGKEQHRLLMELDTNATDVPVAEATDRDGSFEVRLAIAVCRVFIYVCSMGQLIWFHCKNTIVDLRAKDVVRFRWITLPAYLVNWQRVVSLMLTITLICMLCIEPIIHCINESDENSRFTEHCESGERLLWAYSLLSTFAMLLYFSLLVDLSVFSTRISAWVLVCFRVLSELALFLFGIVFFCMAFASAISALEQSVPDFAGIPKSGLSLLKITFGMLDGSHFDVMEQDPSVLVSAIVYIATTVVFLTNLLIAQLNCAYQETYLDMLGYARLNRCKIITSTMPAVSKRRWESFMTSLNLDERVEFGEGDLGIAGGIQTTEPANLHITTVDMIRRFGGSTSPAAQWPQEEQGGDEDEDDRIDRLEKMIDRLNKRAASYGKKSAKGGRGSATGDSGTGSAGGGASGSHGKGSEGSHGKGSNGGSEGEASGSE